MPESIKCWAFVPKKNATVVSGWERTHNLLVVSFMIIMRCVVSEKGSFKERHEAVTDEDI